MANQEQVEQLKHSVEEWNQWREEHPEIRPDINGANLSGANLSDANVHETRLSRTIIAAIDLCIIKGLNTVIYEGPSYVDVKTVRFPEGETRKLFLQGVGFSDTFIEYYHSLFTAAILYASCFISYTHQDEALAKRLYKDLQDKGVRCWFAPHDLRPGTPILRGIEEAIHLHEKLLLILSKDAVMSNWVQQEVEAAFYKGVTMGRDDILFPIRLDNAVLESETLWAKRLRQRYIGDFTNWHDEAIYQQHFAKLLYHLKSEDHLAGTLLSPQRSQ